MKTAKYLMWAALALVAFGVTGNAADANQERYAKAREWVDELHLENDAAADRVVDVIATHLIAVRDWHNSHPHDTVPAGINPRTGEDLTPLDRSIIADSAMPKSVHEELMTGLGNDLSDDQVEAILDKYTIGKVAFTMKAYREIVPNMTEEEDAFILANLKEARERAVDFKSMKQISAIFEIYKTKNERYLDSNGRSWRQMYSDYVKKLKAEKAKKEKQ